MICFIAKRARHAATAGIGHLAVHARFFQYFDLRLEVQLRFMMTMPMHQRFAMQLRRPIILYPLLEELAQNEALFMKTFRILIAIKEIGQFIAEYCHAAWLEPNNRDAFANRLT